MTRRGEPTEVGRPTTPVAALGRLAATMLEPLRWLLLAWTTAAVAAVTASLLSGATVWAVLVGMLALHGMVGLLGSFLLHEAAHLMALRILAPQLRGIVLEVLVLRVSLRPQGEISGYRSAAVALAGPGACVTFGLVLTALPADAGLGHWYLAHVVLLLPVFGDGRALLHGLRTRSAMLATA